MFRAFLVLGVFVALVFAAKKELLEDTGVIGSCKTISAPARSPNAWWACEPGELGFSPNPEARSCTQWAKIGDVAYWSCPLEAAGRPADI
jgi:hypothetical protein